MMDTATGRWQDEVEQEINQLVMEMERSTNEAWATGEINPDSLVRRVADEFTGVQYAPWYQGAVWSADKTRWDEGNRLAAQRYKATGAFWRIDNVFVLPRSPHEVAVTFRVNHYNHADEAPVQALFLETWIKRDGTWWLLRHTAEKAPAWKG